MVKFRTSASEEPKPQSIVLMFRDLNRDPSVKYLYSHQDRVLEGYYQEHLKSKDLALELPTGTGKTLIGLLIAEYRRRALKERIVFLCPTKQLCFQVNEQARRYGIKTALLIGPQNEYDSSLFYQYQQGNAIAITTYSGVFNTNPRIDDPEVIICDDAHAADNYIVDLWTLTINRLRHKELYTAIHRLLQSAIPDYIKHHIEKSSNRYDEYLVDLISNISVHEYLDELKEVLEEFAPQHRDLKYSWGILSSHLEACSVYISPITIEIRPLIPPTQSHHPFSEAKQRIYMSATLGEDGDIERVFGVKKIARLPIPEEWHKRSTGRRLILFPGQSSNLDPVKTSVEMIKKVSRALILVPDNNSLRKWEEGLEETHTIIKSEDIEQNLDKFTKHPSPSVLLLATRYDGIDLPGDDCHFMVLDGEPSASGLQEMYMRTRLGVSSQLQNRIRTRITQAMGRCTRDESDYSIVVVIGDKLTKRYCTKTFTQGIHPELQAEIAFGLDNSTDYETSDFVELSEAFLNSDPAWQEAEQDIRKRRDAFEKVSDSTADALARAMPYEIDYVYSLWRGRYEDALSLSNKVLDALEGGSDLKPYRAFWYHQAAEAAFLAWKHSENESFRTATIANLEKAAASSSHITWLEKLRFKVSGQSDQSIDTALPLQDWFLEIDTLLQEWGITGGKFARRLADVESQIRSKEAREFEKGLAALGRMLGSKMYQKSQEDGAPDGLWTFGDWCAFVFEAKTNERPGRGISFDTLRQAGAHETTVRADELIPKYMPCVTVVISPRNTVDQLAVPHLKDIAYISHDEIIDLFKKTATVLEKLRASASGNTEEALKDNALKFYTDKSIDLRHIKDWLLKKKLKDLPVQ
ncbi:MAG: DEAD/DEAH box helicase family protein [Elainellaceae cyanobacterium]